MSLILEYPRAKYFGVRLYFGQIIAVGYVGFVNQVDVS